MSQLARLREILQNDLKPGEFERLAASLIGNLIGVPVSMARSGFQHGGDAGTTGRQGRHLRIEAKRYADSTSLSDRELLGEIDHAISRDEALEGWFLVATKSVPEQLADDLTKKGENLGVAVMIIDWASNRASLLATLCTSSPSIVAEFSREAGKLAESLVDQSAPQVELLKKDLQSWALGYSRLKEIEGRWLERIWNDERAAKAKFGQNVAGAKKKSRIRRTSVHAELEKWWAQSGDSDSPLLLLGKEGVGKTWASFDWILSSREELPIVMALPADSFADPRAASRSGITRILAEALHDLTQVRNVSHWQERVDRILLRPREEGPAFLVFIDGLNQCPSAPWVRVFNSLQDEPFFGRIRVVASTREHFFEKRLNRLRSLVDPPRLIVVKGFDPLPGGELDKVLALEGLRQTDFPGELLKLAQSPRLLDLMVELRKALSADTAPTLHGILWEYGKDSLGRRTGRTFSEDEWIEWLQSIAKGFREQGQIMSLTEKEIGNNAQRPDLGPDAIYSWLSELIEGPFFQAQSGTRHTPDNTLVEHALAISLLDRLQAENLPTQATLETHLDQWLDPIAGLDASGGILRAAVSILVASNVTSGEMLDLLVTRWLQTQNLPESHITEVTFLASSIPGALLHTIQASSYRSHNGAIQTAVSAVRSISKSNTKALALILRKIEEWYSTISREVVYDSSRTEEYERNRSARYKRIVGTDQSGPRRILGLDVCFVDYQEPLENPCRYAHSLLEGFPLSQAVGIFEHAALNLAVTGKGDSWDELKWLCLLNAVDPIDTANAIRESSLNFERAEPQGGVNPDLGKRTAALLLWLTGFEKDDLKAVATNPEYGRHLTYEKNYLPDPASSYFELEWRHSRETLLSSRLHLHARIGRTRTMWLDPSFSPPPRFVSELLSKMQEFPVHELSTSRFSSEPDLSFDDFEPILARCSPSILASLVREKMAGYSARTAESRFASAITCLYHYLLADEVAGNAAKLLRQSGEETDESNELQALMGFMILELKGKPALTQYSSLLDLALGTLYTDIEIVLNDPSLEEIESLLDECRKNTPERLKALTILLSFYRGRFGENTWEWLLQCALDDSCEYQGLATRILTHQDPARFGRKLNELCWQWSREYSPWINHYCSHALIADPGGGDTSVLLPKIAPWCICDRLLLKGQSPYDTRRAAIEFGKHLIGPGEMDHVPIPELTISKSPHRARDPFEFSTRYSSTGKLPHILLTPDEQEVEKREYASARKRLDQRIDSTRKSGRDLYQVEVDRAGLELLYEHAPDEIDRWLDGYKEPTREFISRMRSAEGVYLALCSTLLKNSPAKGATLWRLLREHLLVSYRGRARVSELIHLAFQCKESPEKAKLLDEILSLDNTGTDRHLLDLVIAATLNNETAWLDRVIAADRQAESPWRHHRAIVFSGFFIHRTLQHSSAWPEGELKSGVARLKRLSAVASQRAVWCKHWWDKYAAAETTEDAYAAWIMFLQSADRRAWSWIPHDFHLNDETSPLAREKTAHLLLNRYRLEGAMAKYDQELEKTFLSRKTVEGLTPWMS